MHMVGLFIIAMVCGIFQPVQALLNGRVATSGLGPLWTGALSAGTSMICLALLSVAAGQSFVAPAKLASLFPTMLAAGAMGGFIVSGLTFVAPRFGPTQTFFIYFGAIAITSLAVDQFGLLGQPLRSLGLAQLLGALFVATGVVLIRIR